MNDNSKQDPTTEETLTSVETEQDDQIPELQVKVLRTALRTSLSGGTYLPANWQND